MGTAIYLLLAVWFSRMATSAELRTNYVVIIERAGYGPLVVAGLLGATFSSALTSLVGAPRILSALASSQVVPRAGWLVGRPGREPRRAMLVTAALSLTALLLRDLNVIAPLITMFFLITYGMINVVVLLEQRLAVVSFRPRLRVPAIVPLVGAVGCLFAMFVVNAAFSLVAVAVVVMVYGLLMRRKLKAPRHVDQGVVDQIVERRGLPFCRRELVRRHGRDVARATLPLACWDGHLRRHWRGRSAARARRRAPALRGEAETQC